jgi:hypothetical protein
VTKEVSVNQLHKVILRYLCDNGPATVVQLAAATCSNGEQLTAVSADLVDWDLVDGIGEVTAPWAITEKGREVVASDFQ